MGFIWFYMVYQNLPSCDGFYRGLPGFNGLYIDLPICSGFTCFFLFDSILPHFSTFYWVYFQGDLVSTVFKWGLLGFIGFDWV